MEDAHAASYAAAHGMLNQWVVALMVAVQLTVVQTVEHTVFLVLLTYSVTVIIAGTNNTFLILLD